MSEPEASPIPEPDTPAPGLPETPAEDEPAAEEAAPEDEAKAPGPEQKPSNAEQLRGLFSERLQEILTGILDRLDEAGL